MRTLVFASTVFVFVVACVNPFAPKLDTENVGGGLITAQKSPEEVFQNFQYAYTFRDSLLYADVIDSAFTFEYFDPNLGSSGGFSSWGRDVEIRTTGRLMRAFDAIELTWLNIIYQDSSRAESERVIYRNFKLTFVGSELNASIQGYGIFTFRKGSDDKWRIRRWVDESSL